MKCNNNIKTINFLTKQYEKMLKSNKTLEHPNGQKANVSTLAVFSILALSLSLMTFPQIIQKAQEMRIVNG